MSCPGRTSGKAAVLFVMAWALLAPPALLLVSTSDAATPAPFAITLDSPANGTSVSAPDLFLNWTLSANPYGTAEVTYCIYMGQNKTLVEQLSGLCLLQCDYNRTSYAVRLDAAGTYFWTVTPERGNTTGACASGVFGFIMAPKPGGKHKLAIMVEGGEHKYRVETGSKVSIRLSVQNQGSTTDVVALYKTGEPVIAMEPNVFTLSPNQTKEVNVTVYTSDTGMGEYVIEIMATSQKEDLTTSWSTFITVTIVKPADTRHPVSLLEVALGFMVLALLASIALLIVHFLMTRRKLKEAEKVASLVADGSFDMRELLDKRKGGLTLESLPPAVILSQKKKELELIDEMFIMTKTGLLMKHYATHLSSTKDQDILAGMLTAVNAFFKESFDVIEGSLDAIAYGKYNILINSGKIISVITITRSTRTHDLREMIGVFVEGLEARYGQELAKWGGIDSKVEFLDHEVNGFLSTQMTKRGTAPVPKKMTEAEA